jgi:hypothetical protein
MSVQQMINISQQNILTSKQNILKKSACYGKLTEKVLVPLQEAEKSEKSSSKNHQSQSKQEEIIQIEGYTPSHTSQQNSQSQDENNKIEKESQTDYYSVFEEKKEQMEVLDEKEVNYEQLQLHSYLYVEQKYKILLFWVVFVVLFLLITAVNIGIGTSLVIGPPLFCALSYMAFLIYFLVKECKQQDQALKSSCP